MSGHTPGPWRFLEGGNSEEEFNRCRPLTICGGNNDDLANVYSADDSTVSITREQANANAQLIAASPDLLEALNAASGFLLNAKIDLETGASKQTAINTIEGGLKIVRAAIAKATGEQP